MGFQLEVGSPFTSYRRLLPIVLIASALFGFSIFAGSAAADENGRRWITTVDKDGLYHIKGWERPPQKNFNLPKRQSAPIVDRLPDVPDERLDEMVGDGNLFDYRLDGGPVTSVDRKKVFHFELNLTRADTLLLRQADAYSLTVVATSPPSLFLDAASVVYGAADQARDFLGEHPLFSVGTKLSTLLPRRPGLSERSLDEARILTPEEFRGKISTIRDLGVLNNLKIAYLDLVGDLYGRWKDATTVRRGLDNGCWSQLGTQGTTSAAHPCANSDGSNYGDYRDLLPAGTSDDRTKHLWPQNQAEVITLKDAADTAAESAAESMDFVNQHRLPAIDSAIEALTTDSGPFVQR